MYTYVCGCVSPVSVYMYVDIDIDIDIDIHICKKAITIKEGE